MGVFKEGMKSDVTKAIGHFKSYYSDAERMRGLDLLVCIVCKGKEDADTKLARETLAIGVTPKDIFMAFSSTPIATGQLVMLGKICKPDVAREIVKRAEGHFVNGPWDDAKVATEVRKARPDIWPTKLE